MLNSRRSWFLRILYNAGVHVVKNTELHIFAENVKEAKIPYLKLNKFDKQQLYLQNFTPSQRNDKNKSEDLIFIFVIRQSRHRHSK